MEPFGNSEEAVTMRRSDQISKVGPELLSVGVAVLLGLVVVLALWLTKSVDDSSALLHSPLAPYLWVVMVAVGVGAGLLSSFRQSMQCTTLFYVPLLIGLVVEIAVATESDGLWVVALFLVGLMATLSAGISVVVRRVRGSLKR